MGTPVVLGDRVLVSETSTGIGTYQLGSAITGYLSPALAGVASGARVAYLVVDSLTAPTAFEIGEGVYTSGSPATLTRAQVRRNTSGGTSAINWGAGTKYLMLTPNAANLPTLDTDGALVAPAISLTGNATVGGTLAVAGSATLANGNLTLKDANTGLYLRHVHNNNGTIGFLSASSAWVLRVDDSGNATATGNVTAYSDARLKTDISTIADGLALVNQMRGVRYTRTETGQPGIGVIAQELQAVLPELVQEGEHLSVAYGNLVGVLIEAVKTLTSRLERLERGR